MKANVGTAPSSIKKGNHNPFNVGVNKRPVWARRHVMPIKPNGGALNSVSKLDKIKTHLSNNLVLYLVSITGLFVLLNSIPIGTNVSFLTFGQYFRNNKLHFKFMTKGKGKENEILQGLIENYKFQPDKLNIVVEKLKALLRNSDQVNFTKEEMKSIIDKSLIDKELEIVIKTSVDVLIEKIRNF